MEIVCYLLFISFLIQPAFFFEKEITVNIDPGREDCFYQWVTKKEVIDFEYQVIDGGNLDITFRMLEPNGRILFADFKKPENNYRTEAQQTGDYKFCLDNKFSTYNSKTVFFELIIERDSDEWNSNETGEWDKVATNEELYDMKVQDIQDAINRVHNHLNKAKHYQLLYKSFEARDRNIAEENFLKVNRFSMLQVAVMMTVGIIQVIMVKSLFDDSSKFNRALKKLNMSR